MAPAPDVPLRDRLRIPHLPHVGNPFDGAKVLSALEANKLRPILVEALQWSAENADEMITQTNKQHARCDIWSGPYGLDEKDIEDLADILMARAQVSAAVAQVVRGAVETFQTAQILLMLGPKFIATVQFYRGHGGFGL